MNIWGKKDEELPESLRGLTHEQLAETLANANKAKQLEEDLAARTQELNAVRTEADQIKDRLNRLEANPQPERRETPTTQRTSFVEDEDRAFQERFDERGAPIAAIAFQAGAATAKLDALRQVQSMKPAYYKLWQKYENEIAEIVKNQPAVNQINPQTWLNAFTFVRGNHAEELAGDKENPFFSEPVTGNGSGHEEPNKPEKLTEQEMKICKKMRITPEKYIQQKKGMTINPDTSGVGR
jgi:chromosome segregation ATPase